MRMLILIGVAGLALAGCGPRVPATNPAYGANPMANAPTVGLTAPGAITSGGIGTGVAAQPLGGVAPVVAPAATAAVAPVAIQSSGISDEQDFSAVTSRESIESAAQRRAQAAAAYQVIQPTALPTAPGNAGPNIVEYALNAPNRLGQEWYSRSFLSGQGRFQRNCASYRSPDEAQRDFLARGGPERDPRGLDPDGDGFACGWDPAPFLAAVGRN